MRSSPTLPHLTLLLALTKSKPNQASQISDSTKPCTVKEDASLYAVPSTKDKPFETTETVTYTQSNEDTRESSTLRHPAEVHLSMYVRVEPTRIFHVGFVKLYPRYKEMQSNSLVSYVKLNPVPVHTSGVGGVQYEGPGAGGHDEQAVADVHVSPGAPSVVGKLTIYPRNQEPRTRFLLRPYPLLVKPGLVQLRSRSRTIVQL